jgi:hypothetical protein
LMFAYDDPNKRENGMLYIGKFNDGVIYAKWIEIVWVSCGLW